MTRAGGGPAAQAAGRGASEENECSGAPFASVPELPLDWRYESFEPRVLFPRAWAPAGAAAPMQALRSAIGATSQVTSFLKPLLQSDLAFRRARALLVHGRSLCVA